MSLDFWFFESFGFVPKSDDVSDMLRKSEQRSLRTPYDDRRHAGLHSHAHLEIREIHPTSRSTHDEVMRVLEYTSLLQVPGKGF